MVTKDALVTGNKVSAINNAKDRMTAKIIASKLSSGNNDDALMAGILYDNTIQKHNLIEKVNDFRK